MRDQLAIVFFCTALTACVPDMAAMRKDYEMKTGLHINRESKTGSVQSKIHRGYPVVVQTKWADVWGRWSAKVAEGEINDILEGYGLEINDDEYERRLAEIYGQPMSLVYVLQYENINSPRLDIVSSNSVIQPDRKLEKLADVGGWFKEAEAYGDRRLWEKMTQSEALMERLSHFRRYYIRLDQHAVTFMFGGLETEYAYMGNSFPTYADFALAIMDTLADIADLVKSGA